MKNKAADRRPRRKRRCRATPEGAQTAPFCRPSLWKNKFVQEDRYSLTGVMHDKASDVKSTRRLVVQKPELSTRSRWFQYLGGKKQTKSLHKGHARTGVTQNSPSRATNMTGRRQFSCKGTKTNKPPACEQHDSMAVISSQNQEAKVLKRCQPVFWPCPLKLQFVQITIRKITSRRAQINRRDVLKSTSRKSKKTLTIH